MRSFVLCLLLFATAEAIGQASLKVTMVLNRPDAGGMMRMAVCPTKKAYDDEKGCTVASVQADGGVVTASLTGLAVGTCAVKVFHDIDGDGELDTSWIGWPQEPYGFSNDAPVNMGPPPFKLAAFQLKEGGNSIRIALRGG